MAKFKVGDKIKSLRSGAYYEILFVGKEAYFTKGPTTESSWDIRDCDENAKLFKEPRTLKQWRNIFSRTTGELRLGDVVYTSKEDAISNTEHSLNYIDTIEINYTEKE